MNKLSPKFRPAHEVVELEDVNIGEWYAVTINPSDQFQFFNHKDRIRACVNNLRKHIIPESCTVYFELYPELSHTGRFHWHGFMQFDDYNQVMHFYLNMIHYITQHATVSMKRFFDIHTGKPADHKVSKVSPDILAKVELKAVIRGKSLSDDELFHLNQVCYLTWYDYCNKQYKFHEYISTLLKHATPVITGTVATQTVNYDKFLSFLPEAYNPEEEYKKRKALKRIQKPPSELAVPMHKLQEHVESRFVVSL